MRGRGLLFLYLFINILSIYSISLPPLKYHSFTLPHLEEPSFLRKFRLEVLKQDNNVNIEEKFRESNLDYDDDDIERDLENNLKKNEIYSTKTEIFDANLENVFRSVCDLEHYPSWSGTGIKSVKLVNRFPQGGITECRTGAFGFNFYYFLKCRGRKIFENNKEGINKTNYYMTFKLHEKAALVNSLRGCYTLEEVPMESNDINNNNNMKNMKNQKNRSGDNELKSTRTKLSFHVASDLPIPKFFERKIHNLCMEIAVGELKKYVESPLFEQDLLERPVPWLAMEGVKAKQRSRRNKLPPLIIFDLWKMFPFLSNNVALPALKLPLKIPPFMLDNMLKMTDTTSKAFMKLPKLFKIHKNDENFVLDSFGSKENLSPSAVALSVVFLAAQNVLRLFDPTLAIMAIRTYVTRRPSLFVVKDEDRIQTPTLIGRTTLL